MFSIDTSTDFGKRISKQLADERVVWLTTVGKSGTPAPNPVWFLWHDGELLISSQRKKAKVHNIETHPQIAVNFNATHGGGDVGVISGTARIDAEPLPADVTAIYNEKYGDDIVGLGMTTEQFHAEYSVVIRITPEKLRGF
ncbi:TIGR03667 family PPOX class F420-dependent oxidoreductase [Kribbella sandramycini]|uniref:PPOX class probable F420-dependent enzyme n=1 Tax=Kribbella sandramycini TaxID=60450 RepID=A0A7Y4KZI6_9ACTN|nr:TIGR03667 family PPOX class F420-dependent oxidoreductase [Kribbella sandramycini]MBB6569349.1 PPOX class probable F420-dependent enzyme [Kribbella sandramycini]NOL40812.1 TIGR03667 family PPOX class F420-dependent oxidoreductase [Kribbella sandramycini]